MNPPQSLDAEQSLLACLLKDRTAYGLIEPIIDGRDFYYKKHEQIFEAIRRLSESFKVVDIGTVSEELVRAGLIEQIGGRVYLVELAEAIASTAGGGHSAGLPAE